MALAALIGAYHDSAEAGAPLRALLPLAGRSLLERQARLAAAAGANPIVILVERMPAGLAETVDRLRRERLPVKVARGAEEAAELVAAEDRLLLVADGFVADPDWFERLAKAEPPSLLTVADAGRDDRYERIDASARWAGLALVEGALLRDTAAGLGDWDPQSTLLRRAVQQGARQVRAEDGLVVAERRGQLAQMEEWLIEGADSRSGSWAERWLLGPVERLAVARMMAGSLEAGWTGSAAALLSAAGALAFGFGILWLGLALVLLATPLEGIADRLGRIRMREKAEAAWWRHLLPVLAGAALLGLGYARMGPDGWGAILAAATTIAFLVALAFETEGREVPGRIFLAERRGMAWMLLPFALFDLWTAGLFFLLAYAAGSFFWAQRHVHGRQAGPAQD